MEPSGQFERAGIRLKRIRERLGLTLREVEAHSRHLAKRKQNPDFIISRGWLNNIENGTYKPSLFKLYALGAIYNVHWSSVFAFFGCNLSDFSRDQAMLAPSMTPLPSDCNEGDDTTRVSVRSRENV